MIRDSARWFPALAPSPGGRASLVAALDAARDTRYDVSPGQAAFACVALLAIAIAPSAMRSLRPDAVATAIAHAAPVAGRDGTLALPPATPGVRVYLVVAQDTP